ncbi:MAG TPA: glycosyltransferase family 39 protein [Anaerolineales bacterium]|nr:glycosyltransferase family 39 protein [Anaerolineales bacterium]
MNTSKSNVFSRDTAILWLLGLALFLLHMFTNNQYGFHQDELVVLDNANNLDWGFVEYPPLTPFLGRIQLALFGLSLVGVRTFSALGFALVLVLTGLMARELGGSKRTQIIAAIAASIAPFALIQGALIQYVSFDFLWVVLLAYLMIRLLKSDDPRWWIPIGIVIGLGMMTKYTMAMTVAGLVGGVLLTDARRYLRSPWLWGGVALSLLVFLPNLIWQIRHDFISLEFLSSIHARDVEIGRADSYLIDQFISSANIVAVPLWIAGLYFYFFREDGKRFRVIGWMYVILFLIYLFTRGRGYYLAPAYPMLIAAGAVLWERWLASSAPNRIISIFRPNWIALGIGTVFAGTLALPIAPINSPWWDVVSEVHDTFTEQIGWQDMIATVAGIYEDLPADEKTRTGILARENDEAAGLNLYGPEYGLPKAISGGNTFWLRGYGDLPPETLIIVGYYLEELTPAFEQCESAATITNSYGVDNDLRDPPTIYVCRGLRFSWPELWKRIKSYS